MSMLTAAHPLMRYGIDCPIVPLTYTTHFVMYNRVLRVPVYVRGMVTQASAVNEHLRSDEFHQDDTLRTRDMVNPSVYPWWNREHPDDPLDLGHGFGSQFRRGSKLQQHDIDVMTNVWPERPAMNRITKRINEGHIVDLGNDPKTRMLIVTNGPGFFPGQPVHFMSDEGPAIPHFSWTHVLRETRTNLQMFAFAYANTAETPELEVLTTNELSDRLGFELLDNVHSKRGIAAKDRRFRPWWD